MTTRKRYVKEEVETLIAECSSFAEVLRRLGKSPVGGNVTNLRLMCNRWGIDTSKMTGQGHQKGKPSTNRTSAAKRLVMGTPLDHRISADRLRRSLFELGVEHKCNTCGIDEWLGKKLVLEIDHIDEQYWNNTPENLQFLCPNCHSMKNK